MKYLVSASTIALVAVVSLSAVVPQEAIAQMNSSQAIDAEAIIDLNRAKNLARQAAERENGGLGQYRAEPSMHGPSVDAPYVVNPDGSWTFTFLGYDPQESQPSGTILYSVESMVTVSQTGQVTIEYNGPIGPTTPSPTATVPATPAPEGATTVDDYQAEIDLNRAKNLARQTAEQTNGGLGQYRAEPSMHGDSAETPHVVNPDGSWTFTFQGYDPRTLGASGTIQYVYESVITVSPNGDITINYNGSVR
jgi:hypothetical protein